jgi:hypothetical protein
VKFEELPELSYETFAGQLVNLRRIRLKSTVYRGLGLLMTTRKPLAGKSAPRELRSLPIRWPGLSSDPVATCETTEFGVSDVERAQLVLPLSHFACQNRDLVGGKAANLARLTHIQHLVRRISHDRDSRVPVHRPCRIRDHNHGLQPTSGIEQRDQEGCNAFAKWRRVSEGIP